MKIIQDNTENLSKVSLVLGFFDGVHLGHQKVIESAITFAKENLSKTVLVTFKNSPQEFFKKDCNYIFSREDSYKLIEKLGVDYILEKDFSAISTQSAEDYLKQLIKDFSPISISTGFNHTFGYKKQGDAKFLENNQLKYNYKYFCIPPINLDKDFISSSTIKKELEEGNIKQANLLLGSPFSLTSTVIKGKQIGRTLGFPTANLLYPEKIVKIPYGVYKVRVLDMPAVLNWGIKPTFDSNSEVLEVHIPNYNGDLYGKSLNIIFLDKIRNEIKFDSTKNLEVQIKKDIKTCLEL